MSPLRFEARALKVKIARVDDEISAISQRFWASGGVCCPSCGVPGFSEMVCKQERREKRLDNLYRKLAKDSTRKEKA